MHYLIKPAGVSVLSDRYKKVVDFVYMRQFSINSRIRDCFIIILTEICSQVSNPIKRNAAMRATQNEIPNSKSIPANYKPIILIIMPLAYASTVSILLKLSLKSAYILHIERCRNTLQKSYNCKAMPITKKMKQQYPVRAIQSIFYSHYTFPQQIVSAADAKLSLPLLSLIYSTLNQNCLMCYPFGLNYYFRNLIVIKAYRQQTKATNITTKHIRLRTETKISLFRVSRCCEILNLRISQSLSLY